MTATTSRAYIENHNGPYSCHDAWTGTLSFTVSTTNAVSGTGALHLTTSNCDFPYGTGGVTPIQTEAFTISGTSGPSQFTLILTGTSHYSAGKVATFAGITALLHSAQCSGSVPGPALSIPFTDPTHASGPSHLRLLMGNGCEGSANSDVMTADTTFSLSQVGS
jgi:hypothetical protein